MTDKTTHWAFWLITLAAVVSMAVTASLGRWQLGRAAEKERLAEQRSTRQALPVAGWDDLAPVAASAAWTDWLDRRVQLDGRWRHEATVYLDNRPMNGRPGFFVVTPLIHESSGAAVAVVRGWVPRHAHDRTLLPPLPEPAASVTVVGRLAPPPSQLYDFGGAQEGLIRQNIDLDAHGRQWSLDLWPVSVQQLDDASADAGLLRDWPVVGSDVHKHYGYALQWFGLSFLILILYVWFQFIAPRRQRRAKG